VTVRTDPSYQYALYHGKRLANYSKSELYAIINELCRMMRDDQEQHQKDLLFLVGKPTKRLSFWQRLTKKVLG